MNDLLDSISKLIRLIKPKHNHWIVRVLIISGLGMLSQPWWVPLVNVAFEKSIGARVGIQVSGWIVLALGLAMHFLNRWDERERETEKEKPSKERLKDYKVLRSILESIHGPTFDTFIEYGRSSYVYDPIFHFFEGFRYLVEGSSYHVNDPQLAQLINRLYESWNQSLGYGEYFTATNNSSLHRLMNQTEFRGPKPLDKVNSEFIIAVQKSDEAYRALLSFARAKYPDIDIDDTNTTAWQEYVSFMKS